MKKIASVILGLLLFGVMAVPCYAISINGGSSTEVKAKYISQTKGNYKALVADEKAEVSLSDGTKIEVEGVLVKGLTLVVIPFDKGSKAYAWFENCTKDFGTNVYPMDIYLEDEFANRVEINQDIKVKITPRVGYSNPIVCLTDEDGVVTVLESEFINKQVVFTVNHHGCFSILEKKPVSSQKDDRQGVSKTGDKRNTTLPSLMIMIAGTVIISFVLNKNKKMN